MRRTRRLLGAVSALALVLAAAPAASADDGTATYQVTITNLTEGQWFTPPAVATHYRLFDVFTVGAPASFEVKEVAENGNLAPITDFYAASADVFDWTVAVADPALPPLGPGQSVTVTLEGNQRHRWLSYASMLICTNDGFTGVDALRLPGRIGQSVTAHRAAYDAGTEINTEAWADLVPPCAMLTGFGDQGGTGTSDPALAEGGVIHHHPGIAGVADLVPSVHDWTDPVSRIRVTRIS